MDKVKNTNQYSVQDIQKLIKKGFSHKHVVDVYTRNAQIWPSEKKIFNKYFNKPGLILDIGCGAGRTSFELAKRGHQVVGIDLSQAMIDKANKRLLEEQAPIVFKVMDALKLDFPNRHFDGAIFSFNGIESTPRKQGKLRLLTEVHRVLKPGSYFFFTSHNLWNLNRHFPIHTKQFLKITFAKLAHIKIREKEYGERYDDWPYSEVPYLDTKTRKTTTELIRKSGLKLVYFNSQRGIEQNKPFSMFKDCFGAGNYLFYVCEKTNTR